MALTIFRSDDASAPAYAGAAGSIITVLDACLVNGYGTKAALGWAKEFTGTNLAAYRAASGNRLRLRVDDTSASAARLRGYEVLTAISTGTGLFPSIPQIPLDASLPLIPKGSGGTSRSWILIGSAAAFYFLVFPSSTDTVFTAYLDGLSRTVFFGDTVSYKQGDAFATAVIGSVSATSNNDSFGILATSATLTPQIGHYLARAHTQLGGSQGAQKQTSLPPIYQNSTPGSSTASALPVPDPILGEIILVPLDLYEVSGTTMVRRSRLPGAYVYPHTTPFGSFDAFTGTGDLAGKTLMCIPVYNLSAQGQILVDITAGAW